MADCEITSKMSFVQALASRRRFGMKPGLDAIKRLAAALGDPQRKFLSVHIAGTNGKGATAAILDSCLRETGIKTGRYTSPHLVSLNERFFINGRPADNAVLEKCAAKVESAARMENLDDLTFFEALTAMAFVLYADSGTESAVLETGLGGRLDATNICNKKISVITKIGLDHCAWLGNTIEAIAKEKAGIIEPGVPVVMGRNSPEAIAAVKRRADALSSPFIYAPDIAGGNEIPEDFSLYGSFNRENAVTAIAVLKTLFGEKPEQYASSLRGFGRVIWPGRFQRAGNSIIDGAHNPPAAAALAEALAELRVEPHSLALVAGFCSDKDIHSVLEIIAPFVREAYPVKTGNPRSVDPEHLAESMHKAGIATVKTNGRFASLDEVLSRIVSPGKKIGTPEVLVCGSLFLAGEALSLLDAFPWSTSRTDPSELLSSQK